MGVSGEPPEVRAARRAVESAEARPRLELVLDTLPPPAPVEPANVEPAPVVRESAPDGAQSEPAQSEPAKAAKTGAPFDLAEERMIRSLAGWLGLTAVSTLGVCGVLAAQWATGRGSVPSAVAAVLTGGVGLWTLLAGWHLGRVVRPDRDDAHELVSAFGNLRSILILKAIGFFLVLGATCFAFSIVASLLAFF